MARVALSITLYMSEIIYRVQNKTYLTGRSRQNGNNHEEVANMQNNDDDEAKNQVLVAIGNAFATLKTKLSEWLVETASTANNVQIDESTNLTLALSMPSNYNKATKDTISNSASEYLTNMAIAEWFQITNKADSKDYFDAAAANIATIREAANKRVRPTHTTVTISG